MALNIYCGNPDCRWHTEVKGGSFTYSAERRAFFCEDCFYWRPQLNDCKNLWDFTTTHFNGEKIHVRDGAHLDQLCKQFGVSNQARENMERNWDRAPERRPEPMNPELARLVAKGNEMRFGRAEIGGGFRER